MIFKFMSEEGRYGMYVHIHTQAAPSKTVFRCFARSPVSENRAACILLFGVVLTTLFIALCLLGCGFFFCFTSRVFLLSKLLGFPEGLLPLRLYQLRMLRLKVDRVGVGQLSRRRLGSCVAETKTVADNRRVE